MEQYLASTAPILDRLSIRHAQLSKCDFFPNI
jgi:hypothetical protein